LWNKDKAQATVTVTITDATLAALADIRNPAQPGYHDTSAVESQTVGALTRPPIAGPTPHGEIAAVIKTPRCGRGRRTGRPHMTTKGSRRTSRSR
jgi:hypothetical protein